MATNDPIWSYGKSYLINSSGAVTDPDSAWSYGENELRYEQPGTGEWCWGHDTGVAEEYIGDLADGTGTGTVSGSGNAIEMSRYRADLKTLDLEFID